MRLFSEESHTLSFQQEEYIRKTKIYNQQIKGGKGKYVTNLKFNSKKEYSKQAHLEGIF